jgi:peptidoglycan/LPS O-acetylase OafA/YrhL
MNGSETILAVVACCAIIAAFLMAAFAYRLNEKWTEIVNKQDELLDKMDSEWVKYFNMVARREWHDRD